MGKKRDVILKKIVTIGWFFFFCYYAYHVDLLYCNYDYVIITTVGRQPRYYGNSHDFSLLLFRDNSAPFISKTHYRMFYSIRTIMTTKWKRKKKNGNLSSCNTSKVFSFHRKTLLIGPRTLRGVRISCRRFKRKGTAPCDNVSLPLFNRVFVD